MNRKLAKFFTSKLFKKITLVLGVVFSLLSLFITVKPEPFLKYGYLGVFAFNLFGPGTLLIPTLARRMNIVPLGLVTSLGMAFNDSISWVIGISSDVIIPRSKKTQKVERFLQKYGFYGFFFLSLLPLPYDFIGFIAGYLKIPYHKFFLPTFLGRYLRMILIGLSVTALFGKT